MFAVLFSVVVCEGLEEEHFEAIMPALLACLDPANGCCPRVVHRTLLALVHVLEAGPEGGVMPHAETLLERCGQLTLGGGGPRHLLVSLFYFENTGMGGGGGYSFSYLAVVF